MKLNFQQFEVLSFDCYGTLIDWESGILAALRPILANHGVQIADETLLEVYAQLEAEAERGSYQIYKSILETVLTGLGKRLSFTPTAAERQAFSSSVRDWPAFPDSSNTLKALQKCYKLAILSNIDDDLFAHSQKKLDIRFDEVFTAQQIDSYKPARRNFEYLIKELNRPAGKILHVAQSLFHDIKPAKELGLTTVWVNRRQHKSGSGATPAAQAIPDLEVSDLISLARAAGLA